MRLIEDFVKVSSCATLVAKETFGADCAEDEIRTCVVDLHVPFDDSGKQAAIAQDVYLCVDVSGSMSSVAPTLVAVTKLVAASLTPKDRICVVTFDQSGRLVWPLSAVTKSVQAEFDTAIDNFYTGGGTNISSGVKLCLEQLAANESEGRFPSLIVLSDGQTCGPRLDELSGLIADFLATHKKRLIVNSIGFTACCDLDTMQAIPSGGNAGIGLFYYLQQKEDIDSAIGDCLGSTGSVSLTDLELELHPVLKNSAWNDDDDDNVDDNDMNIDSQQFKNEIVVVPKTGFFIGESLTNQRKISLGAMSNGERHAFIITQTGYKTPFDAVDIFIKYQPTGSQVPVSGKFRVSMVGLDNK